jgi:hypothetical protein
MHRVSATISLMWLLWPACLMANPWDLEVGKFGFVVVNDGVDQESGAFRLQPSGGLVVLYNYPGTLTISGFIRQSDDRVCFSGLVGIGFKDGCGTVDCHWITRDDGAEIWFASLEIGAFMPGSIDHAVCYGNPEGRGNYR